MVITLLLLIFCSLNLHAYGQNQNATHPSLIPEDNKQITNDRYHQALSAYRQRSYSKAIALLNLNTKTTPIHRKSWELLAVIFALEQQYQDAMRVTYRLISEYHGEAFLRSQSIIDIQKLIEMDDQLVPPNQTILTYYLNMAEYHTLSASRFDPKKSSFLIDQHLKMANKHLYIAKIFKLNHPQYQQVLTLHRRLYKKQKMFEDNQTHKNSITLGGKKEIEGDYHSLPLNKNRVNYFNLLAGAIMWEETVGLKEEVGRSHPLKVQALGRCLGGGYSRRFDTWEWDLAGCYISGNAKVQNKTSDLLYFNNETKIQAVLFGPGIYKRIKENYNIGLQGQYFFRSAEWKEPLGAKIENSITHSFVGLLVNRFEIKNVSFSYKMGIGNRTRGLVWLFNLEYRI